MNEPRFDSSADRVLRQTSDKRDICTESPSDPSPLAPETSPGALIGRQEYHDRLSDAIQRLAEDQRQVTELRSQDHTFEEIAKQMGRSADAVKILWGQAVTRLLKILDGNGDSAQ